MSIIVDDDGIMHKVYTEQEVIDMLYDIIHQIQETEKAVDFNIAAHWWKEGIRDSVNVIQSRINILKAVQKKRNIKMN